MFKLSLSHNHALADLIYWSGSAHYAGPIKGAWPVGTCKGIKTKESKQARKQESKKVRDKNTETWTKDHRKRHAKSYKMEPKRSLKMQLSTHRGSTFHSPGLHFPPPGPRVQLSTHRVLPVRKHRRFLEPLGPKITPTRSPVGRRGCRKWNEISENVVQKGLNKSVLKKCPNWCKKCCKMIRKLLEIDQQIHAIRENMILWKRCFYHSESMFFEV